MSLSEESTNNLPAKTTSFEWSNVGTRFSIAPFLALLGTNKGFKAPPDVKKDPSFQNGHGSFLKVMDVGVKQIHAPDGGLGIPNSYLIWHYFMIVLCAIVFTVLFYITTPMTMVEDYNEEGLKFPYLTLVHKLVIFFNVWESLGLGVLHGPLHQKTSPPFQDWWYRLTPGTMKYNAPFLKDILTNLFGIQMSMKRNYLDIFVEGFLVYAVSLYAMMQPVITPSVAFPVMLCSLYELFFDCGQHMHSYGTQNLHFFICMCFPTDRGQIAGMQLFLHLFYFSSGFCKMGPTFQYMFSSNLLTAKFMVDVPWAKSFRDWLFQDISHQDYRLTPAAWYLATTAAIIEMTLPLWTWYNIPGFANFSAIVLVGMHLFIVSTLIIDVFVWNIVDATLYIILFTVIGKGVDWNNAGNMDPILALWLSMHTLYVFYGHFCVNKVPYVMAHRHAAGNWSQGVMVIRKSALSKLFQLKMHAGIPTQDKLPPGWTGEWFAFHAFMSYVWNWNLPSRFLPALILDCMGENGPTDGMYHSSGDYWLIHSVLFFDALIAHLRFDGLSNLDSLRFW